jgi:hypothetical protein
MPVPSPGPSADAVLPVRAVVLACRNARLAVSGGGVLRLAPGLPCPGDAAGRAFAIGFDPDGAVVVSLRPAHPGETLASADRIPPAAWAVAPSRPLSAGESVSVVVDVTTPPRTPATDDVYLSTDRSSWNATEIRMNRIDGRHFTATFTVPRGSTVSFQVSRGSFSTQERDAAGAITPPHRIHADPGARVRVTVAAWADIT